MKKTSLYLGLTIGFFIIACINLLEAPTFSEGSLIAKFMKVGWFILAGAYLLNYLKFRKADNEKITR